MLCLTGQVGNTEKCLFIFVPLSSLTSGYTVQCTTSQFHLQETQHCNSEGRSLCRKPSGEFSDLNLWAGSQESKPSWHPLFSRCRQGPGTCCYSCQELFTKRMRTQNISMCGSDGRSSWLRPKPNIHNKDKQVQVLSGSWRAPPPGSLPSFSLPDPLSSTSSLLSSSCLLMQVGWCTPFIKEETRLRQLTCSHTVTQHIKDWGIFSIQLCLFNGLTHSF